MRNHGETASSLVRVQERSIDTAVPELLVTIDASGVDTEQDRDAVPSTAGDLWSGHASTQVQRHASVPQIVGPQGKRRVDLGRREARHNRPSGERLLLRAAYSRNTGSRRTPSVQD